MELEKGPRGFGFSLAPPSSESNVSKPKCLLHGSCQDERPLATYNVYKEQKLLADMSNDLSRLFDLLFILLSVFHDCSSYVFDATAQ